MPRLGDWKICVMCGEDTVLRLRELLHAHFGGADGSEIIITTSSEPAWECAECGYPQPERGRVEPAAGTIQID